MSPLPLVPLLLLTFAAPKPLADLPPNQPADFTKFKPGVAFIKVSKAGAAPRRVLQYATTKKGQAKVDLRFTTEMRLDARPLNPPPLLLHTVVTRTPAVVEEVPVWTVETEVKKVELATGAPNNDFELEFLSSSQKQFGSPTKSQVTTTGQKIGADPIPTTAPAADVFVVPFPSDPIGVGAEWEVRSHYPFPDSPMFTRTVYRLDALGPNGGTVVGVTRIDNDSSKAPWTDAEGGAKLKMVKSYGTVRSSIDFDLEHLVGRRGRLATAFHIEATKRDGAGKEAPVVQDTTLTIELVSR